VEVVGIGGEREGDVMDNFNDDTNMSDSWNISEYNIEKFQKHPLA
jgi:hypothetical protein